MGPHPLFGPGAQTGNQTPQSPFGGKQVNETASDQEQATQQAEAIPGQQTSPSKLSAATLAHFAAIIAREYFLGNVDWLDLEAGVKGDPRDFVAHLWESSRTVNIGHGVTMISLGDTTAFLESVGESVKLLQGDTDRLREYVLAAQVQTHLTGSEEGRR